MLYCSCVALWNRLQREGSALNELEFAGVDGLFMCCHILYSPVITGDGGGK